MITFLLLMVTAAAVFFFSRRAFARAARSPFAVSIDECIRATRVLERSPRGPRAPAALAVIGDSFADVELPFAPMDLSGQEADALARDAARDLREQFISVREAYRAGRFGPQELAQAAAVMDPLWLQLSAACWDIVSVQEMARVESASRALVQMVDVFSSAPGAPSREQVLVDVVERVLDRVDYDAMSEAIEAWMAMNRLGMHHARYAAHSMTE